MENKRILFLLINYFNENEVDDFVTYQLSDFLNDSVEVIITDNGSKDFNVLNDLVKRYSNISILKPENNLGYFGAAQYALNQYVGDSDYPDAIIVCNTDISFATPDFISKLKAIIGKDDFDILGPDIYSTYLNYSQNPYIVNRIDAKRIKLYKFVTSNSFFYSMFTLLHLIKTKLLKSEKKNSITERMETYAIHGSFMVFNKSYFTKGGTLKYPSFLFGEELFVAESALKLGLKTVYESSLVVNHFQNSTTGRFKSKKVVRFMHQSYCYLLETFFNSDTE